MRRSWKRRSTRWETALGGRAGERETVSTETLERPGAGAAGTDTLTVAARVRRWAQQMPDQVCMREKDFGIWQEITWAQFWDQVLDAAHGLLALGLAPGDRVSIHSEDRPEWLILDVGHRGDPRHHGRALPDQPRPRGRVPPGGLGRRGPPRRGPGAGRQGHRAAGRVAAERARGSSTSSRVGSAATTTTGSSSGTTSSRWGGSTAPRTRARSSVAWPRPSPTTS